HAARFLWREPDRRCRTLLTYAKEFRISDDPDDLICRLRRAGWRVHLKGLPDRIALREMPPGECLVDDSHARRVRPIAILERPSCPERRRHDAEIVSSHFVKVDVAVPDGAADEDASVPVAAAERHDQRLGRAADARNTPEPRGDAGERLR